MLKENLKKKRGKLICLSALIAVFAVFPKINPPRPEPVVFESTEPEENLYTRSAGDKFLILVSETHPLPDSYSVKLAEVRPGYKVNAEIVEAVNGMFAAAQKDGVTLTICSAYRSPARQRELFDRGVAAALSSGVSKHSAERLTSDSLARPGCSEHHTGLALDIVTPGYTNLDSGFENTDAFRWLDKNAADHGFILSYPKDKQSVTGIIYEPWHWRYVGLRHARNIKAAGLCLREYLEARDIGPG